MYVVQLANEFTCVRQELESEEVHAVVGATAVTINRTMVIYGGESESRASNIVQVFDTSIHTNRCIS
jgi:hypothetical protein